MPAASRTRCSICAFGTLAQLQAKPMLSRTRHVRIERVVLEHHRDVALLRRHVVDDAVADADLAAGDLLQPGDHAQQRRLAAARGADQHAELAVLDRDVHAVHHRGRAEGLAHAAERDRRHAMSPLPSSPCCSASWSCPCAGASRRAPRRAGARGSPRSTASCSRERLGGHRRILELDLQGAVQRSDALVPERLHHQHERAVAGGFRDAHVEGAVGVERIVVALRLARRSACALRMARSCAAVPCFAASAAHSPSIIQRARITSKGPESPPSSAARPRCCRAAAT